MQAALGAGAIAGTILFVYQYLVVVPRIVAAEAYEARSEVAGTEAGGHQHAEWKPDEGLERSAFTAASTILTGIGFAALLLSTVALCGFELDVRRGLLWDWRALSASRWLQRSDCHRCRPVFPNPTFARANSGGS